MQKVKKPLSSNFTKILIASLLAIVCIVAVSACTKQQANFDPVYQKTDEAGKEIYAWPKADEEGTIEVEGGKVSYRLYGKDKQGTPIIGLHGGPGGNYGCFYKQLPLAENRPFLLYDQLGSPETEIYPENQTPEKLHQLFTIDNYMKELDTVIKHFNFKDYIFYTSSWGCMLGVEYAGHYKPAGLKGMILAGPFLNVDRWVADQERLIRTLDGGDQMMQEIRKCEATGQYSDKFNEINEIYTKNFNNRHPEDCKNRPTMVGPDGKAFLTFNGIGPYKYMWGASEFSCTGTLQHHDSTVYLRDINVPIMYLPGQYDAGTPEAALYYCSLTKNGEVAVIPGAAHAASNERPDEVRAIINGFLSRNSL